MIDCSRKIPFVILSLVHLIVWESFTSFFVSYAFTLETFHALRCKDPILKSTKEHGQHGDNESGGPGVISSDWIYFDIEIANQPIGRLIFHLTNPSPLPKHAENMIQLAKGSRRGIDPEAHYVGCEFDFSVVTVEDGMGRYRWSHQLRGRGRNGIGKADEPIYDPESQAACCHSTFGGQYYGDIYTKIENDPGVMLTVPVAGPGYGSSKFSIVRVEESPKEWKETLLINSGVIGRLARSSLQVLHIMARQKIGPPIIVSGGASHSDENAKDLFQSPEVRI